MTWMDIDDKKMIPTKNTIFGRKLAIWQKTEMNGENLLNKATVLPGLTLNLVLYYIM